MIKITLIRYVITFIRYVITFIRYDQNQKIGKSNNVQVFGAIKPKSLNRIANDYPEFNKCM
jgi:hypothetical protein